LVFFRPNVWLADSKELIDAQLKAVVIAGSVLVVGVKLFQGFYFAKLRLDVTALAFRSADPRQPLAIVSLKIDNIGQCSVSVSDASLLVNGKQIADREALGFGPVACENWILKRLWGTHRAYNLVCGTTETRQVSYSLGPDDPWRFEFVMTICSPLSIAEGVWRSTCALTAYSPCTDTLKVKPTVITKDKA
jgi:hypothetical protein